MTAPVGATRHTSVSSRGIRGRNWLVWNPPDDVIGLVYQFSFFYLTYFCVPSRLGTNLLRLSLDLSHRLPSF